VRGGCETVAGGFTSSLSSHELAKYSVEGRATMSSRTDSLVNRGLCKEQACCRRYDYICTAVRLMRCVSAVDVVCFCSGCWSKSLQRVLVSFPSRFGS